MLCIISKGSAYDETLVDFIAVQFPKLQNLFKSQEV